MEQRRLKWPFWRTVVWCSAAYLCLLGCSALFFAPFAWMLSVSIHDLPGVFAQPFRWIPDRVMWRNYADVTSLLPFWRYTVNTAIITVLTLTGTLLSCSLVAFGFAPVAIQGA